MNSFEGVNVRTHDFEGMLHSSLAVDAEAREICNKPAEAGEK
jgi:hypothetical protein